MKKYIQLMVIMLSLFVLGGCTKNGQQSTIENSVDQTRVIKETTQNVRENSQQHLESSNSEESSENTVDTAVTEMRLIAVGDNLMHRSVSLSGQQADGSWNYTRNFENVAPLVQQADIAVINQECVMGGLELGIQNYPLLNTGTEVGSFIVNAGFDVVLAANNHILDQNYVGVHNMMNYWRTTYPQIPVLGVHESQEEQNTITVMESHGIKLALLNYTYDTNTHDALQGRPWLVDYIDKERMASDIAKAKEMADFVVVFPHWGEEYVFADITDEQRELTAFFAEQGVDLVIGAHPHVVEPVQFVEREGDRPMLVYYSLGNFQSIQYKTETMLGGLADVTIRKDGSGTYIVAHSLKTLVTHFQNTNPSCGYFDFVTTYLWEQYTPELAAQHDIRFQDSTFSYERLVQLQQQIMSTVQ
ncbi:Capsule biosynthesis protein CapA [Clostridiales bacterium CHKCI001]|nr:Capsule biosynthesis protein CapA [Clostridiales bacterium CHKCI001]